jgi:hypothetical protein
LRVFSYLLYISDEDIFEIELEIDLGETLMPHSQTAG